MIAEVVPGVRIYHQGSAGQASGTADARQAVPWSERIANALALNSLTDSTQA